MKLVPVLALALVAAPLAAQTEATRAARAVSADVYRSHLGFLSDDLLEGRAPGRRGGLLAARYIAAQFERLGLEPAGDSGTYYHRVPIIALDPSPTLQLGSAAPLSYKDDYVLWSMRDEPAVTVEGEAVFVGHGIVAPEYQWDDYAGADVKGRIVVVMVNDPGLRDSTIFRGRILTYYGRWTYKIEEAARHGAAGILLLRTTETATYGWPTVAGSWTGPQVRIEKPATSLVVAGWLSGKASEALFAAAGKDLNALTAAAYRRGFKAVPLGVTVKAEVRSTIRRSETANVVARLPGRGPLADQAVIIGGHYDHLGTGLPVKGDSIYNGAEDNASGTAGVLAAAEALVRSGVRPARSIVFMGIAAEESGLLGAQAYVERPTVPLTRIAAMLNMDVMNLYGRTRDIAALGTDLSSLGPVFRQAAAAEGMRVSVNEGALIRGAFFRSDHFPFAKGGVPALSVEPGTDFVGRPAGWGEKQRDEYGTNRYHQPADELLPWFSMDGAIQQLRVIVRTALAVANTPAMPKWNPGTEFSGVRR
ncbi:MAG: M20/M25/M40 family metallo-hydrolase [Gemmatimonadota bacterium]